MIYGDSVTGDTPILCRLMDGKIIYKTINQISCGYWIFNYHGNKEVSLPIPGIQVWTENGFVTIKKIIRHKTKKKLFRIISNFSCIDITEDHSLLTPFLKIIKPTELFVGYDLLHCKLPKIEKIDSVNIGMDEAYIWGVFFINGFCHFDKIYSKNNIWIIFNINNKIIKKIISILEEIEPSCSFKIRTSSKNFQLIEIRKSQKLIKKYKKIFYDENNFKKLPDLILNSTKNIQYSFWKGCLENIKKKSFYLINHIYNY